MAVAEAGLQRDLASPPREARSWAPAGQAADPPHRLLPEARVHGQSVYGPSGDKVASVLALAIDEVTGEVAYAVVREGGFLGFGQRRHAVPWSLLDYDPRKDGYVIPLDGPALAKAPILDGRTANGDDDLADRDAIQRYYQGYGATPYWT